MKIKFINAKILFFDGGAHLEDGEVCVEDDKIVFAGKGVSNSCFVADKIIDVNSNVLMPAFVDAHTHSAMTLLRSIKDDATLEDWLFNAIVPIEARLEPSDVYWATKLAVLEYLAGGITTIDDMYYFPMQTAKAISESGMRARICVGNIGPSIKQNNFEKTINELSKIKNISVVSSIHSIYATSPEDIDGAVMLAGKRNLALSTHLSETLKEVGDCSVKYQKTPVEYLEDFGFFDRNASLYHCVHMDKDDLEILSRYNTSAVICAGSNLKIADGFAPVKAIKHAGINIAIGTDGVASNNALDMFREMYLTATALPSFVSDPLAITAGEALYMATKGGAISVGIDNLGEIKAGNLADIILVDISRPHMMPHNNILSSLVYCAKSSDVYLTMSSGKILYQNGEYTLANKQQIYKNVDTIIDRLKGNN